MKRKMFFLCAITILLSISWTENGYDRIQEGTSDFAVLGWSRDGKIAYEESVYVDAMPGTIRGFVVFDLVEDKIVFETSYTTTYGDDSHNAQSEEE